MRIPYLFNGFVASSPLIKNLKELPLSKALIFFEQDEILSLGKIYFEVQDAMIEKENDFLKEVMEPNLFNFYSDSMQNIKSNNFKLKTNKVQNKTQVLGEEDMKKLPLFLTLDYGSLLADSRPIYENENNTLNYKMSTSGVLGRDLIRSNNVYDKKKYNITNSLMEYYTNFNDFKEQYQKNILVANIIYQTNKKLAQYDRYNKLVEGNDDENLEEIHIWRFETYTNKIEWTLTDMDFCLGGNPYYTQK